MIRGPFRIVHLLQNAQHRAGPRAIIVDSMIDCYIGPIMNVVQWLSGLGRRAVASQWIRRRLSPGTHSRTSMVRV